MERLETAAHRLLRRQKRSPKKKATPAEQLSLGVG
jgi:hypothetical protein